MCNVIDVVPAYRIKRVARLAEQCAQAWHQFAQELMQRENAAI
jgi:hypothetical protein